MSPEVTARLAPEARYGVWWSGRKAFERKLVPKNGPEGPRYKYSYKVKERAPEDRIGVPVPDSGIPRKWVDAERDPQDQPKARTRRRSGVGATGGILRCAECSRAMSVRTFIKPKIGRTYLYYTCVSGAAHKPDTAPH